jgi:hypothetical protein
LEEYISIPRLWKLYKCRPAMQYNQMVIVKLLVMTMTTRTLVMEDQDIGYSWEDEDFGDGWEDEMDEDRVGCVEGRIESGMVSGFLHEEENRQFRSKVWNEFGKIRVAGIVTKG